MPMILEYARDAALALAMLLVGISPAGAEPAGTAVGVATLSEVTGGSQPRTLAVGGDLFIGDIVRTSARGRVEIIFSDDTQLVVGPGSTLEIADYLLRSDGSAGTLAVKALAGTFRFVSGSSAFDRYRIVTPTGTIGIRGTAFDFVVDAAGSRVIMYKGATELCARTGDCQTVSNRCELGTMSSDGATSSGATDTFSRADRRALRKQFVFGASQQALSANFRLRETADCLLSPLPFTPGFFAQSNTSKGSAAAAATTTDAAGNLVAAAPIAPAPPTPPQSSSSGDCAGNSDRNPGKSSNCNK
jgi:hypothetical protein